MKIAVKMTPMGLHTASSATGMPLKPMPGRDWYVDQKNSVLPERKYSAAPPAESAPAMDMDSTMLRLSAMPA